MSAGNLGQAILSLGTDQSALDQGLSDAQGKVEGFGARASQAVGKLAVFGLAASGLQQLGGVFQHVSGFFGSFISDADNSAKVLAQTQAVIKSTGDASGLTAQQVADLATQLSGINPIDDEVIQSVTNMLLTFKNIGGTIIPQVTQTALDMAQALGTDATSGAIQLGKALNDPITGLTALQRVGVTFTQSQKDVIQSLVETGQTAKAQQIILDELNSEFGGSSAAAAATFGGQMEILQTKIGNVKETLGSAFLPVLTDLTTTISDRVLPSVQRFADWFTGLPDVVQRSIAVIGGVIAILTTLVPAAAAAGAAMIAFNASLGVVGLVALALTAVISAIGILIVNWDAITAKVPILGTALDVVVQSFKALWDGIVGGVRVAVAAIEGFGLTIAGVFDTVKTVLGGVGQIFDDITHFRFDRIAGDVQALGENATAATQKIKDGFGEIVDSVDQFSKKTDGASEAADHFGGAAEQMQAGVFSGMQAVQGLTASLNDWTEAQRAVDASVKQSGDAVDVWTQKQSAAQKALDDLDAIKKQDGGLNADQQAQYDTLTHYVARLGAGITDDLQPAYISAQVAAAKFQETQDVLNKQLADGQITQEQYNQAVAAAKDAAQAALDPTTKLADANANLAAIVDKLNQTLHDTLVALGLLPAETPVHVTDDGTIDRTKGKLLEMNGVVIDTPKQVTITANVNTGNAIDQLDAVHRRAYDSTFTITAYVNTGPFEEGIARIDRMIPHSPAEEGPLSVAPNWDWLFAGLDAAAATRTDDALDHIKKFVDTAKDVWDTLKEEVSFSADVTTFQSAGGTLPSDEFITQLKFSAEHAIQSMGDTAALFSGDFIDATQKLGDAITSAYGGLSAEVSFAKDFAAAGDAVDQFTANANDIETRLKFAAEHAVQSLGDSAAFLGSDVVAAAKDYGDAVDSVYSALSSALSFATDTITAMNSGVDILDGRVDSVIDGLADLSQRAGQRFAAIGAEEADNLDAAKAAGDALAAPFSALGAALSFVKDLADAAKTGISLIVPEGVLTSLSGLIARMSAAFLSATHDLDTDVLENAKDLADSLSAPFQVYEDALSFVKDSAEFLANDLPPDISDTFVASLTSTITKITATFKAAAVSVGTNGLDDATALANALGPILSTIQPISDGIHAIVTQMKLPDRPLDTFKSNVSKLLGAISEMRIEAEAHLQDALVFQQTMEAIAASLTATMSAIDTITGNNSPNTTPRISGGSGGVAPPSLNVSTSGGGGSAASSSLDEQLSDVFGGLNPVFFSGDSDTTKRALLKLYGPQTATPPAPHVPEQAPTAHVVVNVDGQVVYDGMSHFEQRQYVANINPWSVP